MRVLVLTSIFHFIKMKNIDPLISIFSDKVFLFNPIKSEKS